MDASTPHSGSAIIAVTRAALALLFMALILGQILTVVTARTAAQGYPEFAALQLPLTSVGIVFGICVECVLLITGVLVGYTRDGRIFGVHALRLVDLMTGAFAVATVLVIIAVALVPGPPVLGLLMAGGALVGATFTLVLLVLRALLRRAASMRVELDEVI